MADNEHRLLRRYIKESLVSELGLGDIAKGVGGVLGIGPSGKSSIDKWFSGFMSRQLDAVGKQADEWIGQKLDRILPDSVLSNIDKYAKNSGEKSSSTVLAKVIAGWIDDVEEMTEKEFSEDQKKQIYQFAANEYAAVLKRDPDAKKALALVKRKLDMKYGSLLSKPKEQAK
jgi:hypothetical protein